MTDPNRNAAWGRVLLDELHRSGVRHVCISPGSRSTPLTLAAANHPGLRCHVLIDERDAGFYALGIARISGAPAALICTSGSAGAHYLPAVIEANEARVPMIVLTADRPAELMQAGAGQTIDQIHLLGRQVRAFVHADLPHIDALALRHLRATANRLVATSQGLTHAAPGPVHMNLPFREPLAPIPVPGDIPEDLLEDPSLTGRPDGKPWISYRPARPALPDDASLDRLAAALDEAHRPILVCGPLDATTEGLDAILALASEHGVPLLADPASQLRHRPGAADNVFTGYDAALRTDAVRTRLRPDLVIRFGAQPTSKVYRFWRETHPEVEEVLIEETGALLEPTQWSHELFVGAPGAVARELHERTTRGPHQTPWLATWRAIEEIARAWNPGDVALWEGEIARIVARGLRAGDALLMASSMPIRDFDAFGGAHDAPVSVLANRGANGIDGLISTALGAAATGRPVVAVIGDVATLHNVGGWFGAHHQDLDAVFVIVNNGGGGIFSYLPIARYPEHFERMFLTPHEVRLPDIARAYGVTYHAATEAGALQAAIERARGAGGVHMIEATVDLGHNVAIHTRAWHEIAQALEEVVP